jgi:hypothetical protein
MSWINIRAQAAEPRKLYVDLDGVLANYDKAFEELTGYAPGTYDIMTKQNPQQYPPFYTRLRGRHDYWAGLEWLPGAESFWSSIKQYSPTILSSPTRDETSKTGKTAWVEKNLGAGTPVILDSWKANHASPNSVLVDDMDKHIRRWADAGGIPIQHAGDYGTTLKKVQDAMAGKDPNAIEETQ